MRVVAIVGAGELGGALAHALAARNRLTEVRLIDPTAGDIARAKALDIQQAGPIQRFDTTIRAASDLSALAGAPTVVVADPAGLGADEWDGAAGLAMLDHVARLTPASVIVCARAAHRWVVERGVGRLGLPRERLLGSAPGAFVAGLRALTALEAGGAATDVSIAMLGIPPEGIVVPWNDATLAGQPLAAVLSPPRLRRLRERARALWPPGPYALASACARVSEAIALGSRRVFCGFAVLDGELEVRRHALAFPVSLGTRGIERFISPTLSAHERVQFENALQPRPGSVLHAGSR